MCDYCWIELCISQSNIWPLGALVLLLLKLDPDSWLLTPDSRGIKLPTKLFALFDPSIIRDTDSNTLLSFWDGLLPHAITGLAHELDHISCDFAGLTFSFESGPYVFFILSCSWLNWVTMPFRIVNVCGASLAILSVRIGLASWYV